MKNDYQKIMMSTANRVRKIEKQLEELEMEKAKLIQFFRATINLLPEETQKAWNDFIISAAQTVDIGRASLAGNVRYALISAGGEWLTVAEVRDSMMRRGFDFSGYVSNPLASVSTTLKRLCEKDDLIESRDFEGTTAYRWKGNALALPPMPKLQSVKEEGK